MPPNPQKTAGKKGGSMALQRQRSRNSTPGSPAPAAASASASAAASTSSSSSTTANLPSVETVDTQYMEVRAERFRNLTHKDIIDQGALLALIPDSRSIDAMITRLQKLSSLIETRSQFFDRGMRFLASARKNHPTTTTAAATATVQDDVAIAGGSDEEPQKRRKKRRRGTHSSDSRQDRPSPPVTKAKSATPSSTTAMDVDDDPVKAEVEDETQDGPKGTQDRPKGTQDKPKGKHKDEDKDQDKDDDSDKDSSSDDDEGYAPRKKAVPQAFTFGEDPATFPDPTVYEIRPVQPGMSVDEIKEIYSVSSYPKSDLKHLLAGEAADKDLSNAKPTNQISFSTFSTYTEPFFRPFTEEDLTFLRERGDRVTPFHMPKRGKKHYREHWAEEDGDLAAVDPHPLPAHEARGSIDIMSDMMGETDRVSVGPLLSRLLQAIRPESHHPASSATQHQNQSQSQNQSQETLDEGRPFLEDGPPPTADGTAAAAAAALVARPAAWMPESSQDAWKKVAPPPRLEYSEMDERIKQELQYIGFLPDAPLADDYDGHYDDEVAARLRLLQARLRDQMLINGGRKARLAELVKERMAHQEYQTILEDLDGQLNAAYLKRTRVMGKSKKSKRPVGAGGAGGASGTGGSGAASSSTARPALGDVTKMLLDRRKRWTETIGAIFDDASLGRIPSSSIFAAGEMADLVKREREAWDEEVE